MSSENTTDKSVPEISADMNTSSQNTSVPNSTSTSEPIQSPPKPLRDEKGRLLPGQALNPTGKRRRDNVAPSDVVSAVDILRSLLKTSTDRKEKTELAKTLLPYEQPRLSTTEATDLQDNTIIIKLPEFPKLTPSDPIFSLSSKPLKDTDESSSNPEVCASPLPTSNS